MPEAANNEGWPSKLTLGTVQLGLPYGINNRNGMPSEQESFAILDEAWNAGVISYDTASAYGQSEAILGNYFSGRDPVIITKLHLAPEANVSPKQIAAEMMRQVEASLQNLRRNTIPVLMLHTTGALQKHGPEITNVFRSLLRQGLIGKAGISISFNTWNEYSSVWNYLKNETYQVVQLPMNLFDHRPLRNGVLPLLAEAGREVYVRSVFLQGLFFMREEDVPAHLQSAGKMLRKLNDISRKYDFPVAQMAVSFIRDTAGVHSLVIGAETPEQVRDNLRLMQGSPLPEELRKEILDAFYEAPEQIITPPFWSRH